MIEVNLLPEGRKKKGPRRGPRWSLPSLPDFDKLPKDRWILGAVGAGVFALATIGFLFFQVAGVAEELEVRVEEAVQDSTRYADIIEGAERLQARSDSIAQRVAVIQEIDGARYVWPHLLDEVARALPDFTWLMRFTQITPEPDLTFTIEGRAGTYFALTTFMENLETSPFIRGVRLLSSDQVSVEVGDEGERSVYEFTLEAARQDPPREILETIPLFGPAVGAPELPDPEGDQVP